MIFSAKLQLSPAQIRQVVAQPVPPLGHGSRHAGLRGHRGHRVPSRPVRGAMKLSWE